MVQHRGWGQLEAERELETLEGHLHGHAPFMGEEDCECGVGVCLCACR